MKKLLQIAQKFSSKYNLSDDEENIKSNELDPTPKNTYSPLSPELLSKYVDRAIKEIPKSEFFGRYKVFISDIWDKLKDKLVFSNVTEDEFKQALINAHREGKLRLARADLSPAMSKDKQQRSEANYLNAQFHMVDTEK